MMYIIGDSHVSIFSGCEINADGVKHMQPDYKIQYTINNGKIESKINSKLNKFEERLKIKAIKIGSPTAYNSFNKLQIIEQAIEEYRITNNDYFITCFGEIDIRHHIGFHCDIENITITKGIENCVDRYLTTLKYLKDKGINVGVYAPIAQSAIPGSNVYKDVVFRNKMTIEFNNYLKKKCDLINIPIIDISKEMMLPDGTTNLYYLLDGHHLSIKAIELIKNKIKEVLNYDI